MSASPRMLNYMVDLGLPGFWTLSIIQYSKKQKNTTFRKLDLFPSSGGGQETPTQLCPLERDSLKVYMVDIVMEHSCAFAM
jgi:hypothetical protein